MDRKQEYWDLISQLNDTPQALDTAVDRARARRKKSHTRRWLGVPVATLGGIASAFILLVNFSIPFALACRTVPFLREMVAAVAFSDTLKAAVENEYFQYVGQTQTAGGVTMTVHYLILDQSAMNVFYTIDAMPVERCWVEGDHKADGLEAIQGAYGFTGSNFTLGDSMQALELYFDTESSLPDPFPLRLKITPDLEPDYSQPPESFTEHTPWDRSRGDEPEPLARFAFDLPLDPRFTAEPEVLEVGRWFEVDGQRLYVDTVELYPLKTKITIEADPENTMALEGLDLYLEGADGQTVDSVGGLIAMGSNTFFLGSVYFSDPQELTLCVTEARWSPQGGGYVDLNIDTGETSGLPPWAEFETVERVGGDVRIALGYEGVNGMMLTEPYLDPQGGEHIWNGIRSTGGVDNSLIDYVTLEDYPWDTVRLKLRCTDFSTYEEPLRIPLK